MTQGYLNNVNDFHGAVCVLLVGKNIFCCTMHNVDRKIFLSKKKESERIESCLFKTGSRPAAHTQLTRFFVRRDDVSASDGGGPHLGPSLGFLSKTCCQT